MTIEYHVSHNGRRIDTYPKGVLDIKETIDYFNRIKNDSKIKRGAVEIVYFKYVSDFRISYLESEEIAKSYQEAKSTQMIDKTIFICESDLAFGIGRMLQILHEITNPNHEVFVIRSESELENILEKSNP
jgi:hypothetical protein